MSFKLLCADVHSMVLTYLDRRSLLLLSQTCKSERHSAIDHKHKCAVHLMNALFAELTSIPYLESRIAVYETEPAYETLKDEFETDPMWNYTWKAAFGRRTIVKTTRVDDARHDIVMIESCKNHDLPDDVETVFIYVIIPSLIDPTEGTVYDVGGENCGPNEWHVLPGGAKEFVDYTFEETRRVMAKCKAPDVSALFGT